MYKNVTIDIVEQPASKSMRFRYSCEGRSAGSIPGVNSTQIEKTFPAIRVLNYTGMATVVVSCVTKDKPYKPHPYSLVGKECTRGVCSVAFKTDANEPVILKFSHLGIQCVKKNEVEKVLTDREFLRIDPFKTGFKHKDGTKFLDLNVVRLCFQVILTPEPSNKATFVTITPKVSNPIYDKKALTDLHIFDISDTISPSTGGKKIMIFCEKVLKEDIKVRFFELVDDAANDAWEGWADFKPTNVHRQTAIAFITPRYRVQDIDSPANVYVQLVRPSDDARSDPLTFQYVPDVTNIDASIRRKRAKIEGAEGLYKFLASCNDGQRQLVRQVTANIVHKTENQNIPDENESQRRSIAANFDPEKPNICDIGENIQRLTASNFDYANFLYLETNQQRPQQSHQQPCDNIFQMQLNRNSNLSHMHHDSHQNYYNSRQYVEPMPSQFYNITSTTEHLSNWTHSIPTDMNRTNNIAEAPQIFPAKNNIASPTYIADALAPQAFMTNHQCGAQNVYFPDY